jgi:DNA-binding protein HU-beta
VNKAELIETLSKRLGDRRTATVALESVVEEIERAVQKGERVAITGFGVFEKRIRNARTARNPRTGEAVKVKKTSVPAFRPGQGFKDIVTGAKKLAKAPAATVAAAKAAPAKAAAAAKATAAKTAAPAKKASATKKTTAAAKKTTAAKNTPATKKTTAAAKKAPPAKKAPAAKKTTAAVKKTTTPAKKAPAKKTAAKKAPATKRTAGR